VSPGNTFILTNYILFLLEQKNFDQYNKVMPHAKRIMDTKELEMVTKLGEEFKEAIDGTVGKVIPGDENIKGAAGSQHAMPGQGAGGPAGEGGIKQIRSALKQVLAKRVTK